MHQEKSILAGKVVRIKKEITHPQVKDFGGSEFRVEDWWDKLTGRSWMHSNGNPACLVYAMRTGLSKENIPIDDEVLYGKVGNYGHLVHISELKEESCQK